MNFDAEKELREKADKFLWNKYQERRKNDLRVVLSSEEGRRFIAQIFAITGFRADISVDNASKRDWHLGRRSVAVGIFREIAENDLYDFYQKMEQEDIAQQRFDEAEKKKLVEQFNKRG